MVVLNLTSPLAFFPLSGLENYFLRNLVSANMSRPQWMFCLKYPFPSLDMWPCFMNFWTLNQYEILFTRISCLSTLPTCKVSREGNLVFCYLGSCGLLYIDHNKHLLGEGRKAGNGLCLWHSLLPASEIRPAGQFYSKRRGGQRQAGKEGEGGWTRGAT